MMSIMDAALLGLVGALVMVMIAMAWRVPQAISESSDKLGARLDAKIDSSFAQLNAKIDDTNVMLADVRERVAYLEGRAGPPPKAA